MSAERTFPALADMMGSCFHQDMDLEAETVPEAVALYARGLSADAGKALQAEIDSFRQQHPADLDEAFLQAFGDDLDPSDAGFGTEEFLRMVDAVVEDPAALRQFLEADLRPEFPQLRRLARACLDLPALSAEARRLGLAGADSVPHALSIHLGALPATERPALLLELQEFEDLYGDRATEVFGKRWFDLETGLFGSFRHFRQAVERISANPADFSGFTVA
ncbi:contact-dependent growth inhibition system immunity protein [Rhizobium tumorigenes]|uniref:Contact-dependent growth inhibition system immunity protein n=1 Tax=Rhizobium tumorigenes TaxID=2041385 RepID=A0AAF1KWJ0_9HYPH|nr:contact-dependent growth inhibition system immunity protein [Rhizobium tumorigenes]WFR98756.1 contact-dependent growth inhibition system immunity protein [Rhizobium tumorigenes]